MTHIDTTINGRHGRHDAARIQPDALPGPPLTAAFAAVLWKLQERWRRVSRIGAAGRSQPSAARRNAAAPAGAASCAGLPCYHRKRRRGRWIIAGSQ